MLKWIKEVWSGFLIGTANIIPGVSGGTLLFLLGLYERTITAVSGFGGGRGAALLRHAWGTLAGTDRRREHFRKFVELAWVLDIPFLIRLLCGAGLAILLLSSVMEYLLDNQFANTYAFFFGLIAMSVVMSVKMLKVRKPIFLIHIALGAAVTVAVTAMDNPVGTAEMRSARYVERFAEQEMCRNLDTESSVEEILGDEFVLKKRRCDELEAATSNTAFKYLGQYSIKDIATATASGAVAICAMILPGLSGSLVLILLGQYQEVISAISNLKTLQLDYFVFLSIMAIGMIIGILFFARVVEFVFKRYRDGTIAFLTGLMVGSLYALWPFKKVAVIAEQYVKDGAAIAMIENAVIQTNVNALPADAASALFAVILCAAGAGIMIVLEKYGVESDPPQKN